MDSIYVELAIGLALAFFLLSLLVSWANEAIARMRSIRGKYLWAYLRDMLDGPADKGSRLPARVSDVFVRLPLNRTPGRDPRPPYRGKPPAPDVPEQQPLADRLHQRLQEIDRPVGVERGRRRPRRRSVIADIPPSRFATAVLEIITDAGGETAKARVATFLGELKAAQSPFYLPLRSMWDTADDNMGEFKRSIESWFDSEMQRLTKLYRRHARWVITAIAVVVALFFSLDSVEYSKALLADDAYRDQVVVVANGNPEALAELERECGETQPPAAGTGDGAGQVGSDTYRCVTEVLSSPAFVRIFQHSPVRLDIPAQGEPTWSLNGDDWVDRLAPTHWPGYLITIIALLFGAPFWWDVLRRVSGVNRPARRTGR